EASGLANIFLCSEGLPTPKRTVIRNLCVEYAQVVIDDEWQTLRQGKYSQPAFHTVFRIWKEITSINPVTEGEQNIHQQLVSEICT
ncbi:hypothetical protein ABTG29_18685, partial [Acinetobacter baumannii]